MTHDDRRLIEDYLPIQAISAEASREKSVRKGHISTLHLWWARRPLVACRAAVYGALVPASQFVPDGGSDAQKKSLGRANAAKFIERLCQYPGSPDVIKEAQEHILKAHVERLTRETGKPVTVDDIVAGRAPRPKVLDMFAGGGAIPLEALRLGCEAYALDLNPVAHIIQLCTLVYPQRFGKPEPNAKGSAKDGTWAGLAGEVEHWGKWMLEKVKAEIGDLYPAIPDPAASGEEIGSDPQRTMGFAEDPQQKLKVKRGFLTPVAYLWTRTVRCKNPACGATVPLVKQTWLCKKKDRYVAMRIIAPKGGKRVQFEIVESHTESGLGFDPEAFSKAGNATCPFCGTVADSDYAKVEGCEGRIGEQLMAIVCVRSGKQGKIYLEADNHPFIAPDTDGIRRRIDAISASTGLSIPSEDIGNDAKNANFCILYGLKRFGDLFNPRQSLSLLTFIAQVRISENEMIRIGLPDERRKAIVTYLGLVVDRVAMFGNRLCAWYYQEQAVSGAFGRQALPMLWDYGEVSLNAEISGGIGGGISRIVASIAAADGMNTPANVVRGPAQNVSEYFKDCDAVITDPPYYDNIPYANLADFFYVWLKRSVGHLYPEHFGSEGTPKKAEAVADATRHGGSRQRAKEAYEENIAQSFAEAHKALKSGGQMVVVYAHKTTLGWTTLVDALRKAAFTVTEAWPLDTEGPGRLRARDSSALATSIFIITRKRDGAKTGSYEEEVRPELEQIVRERVETLWRMGITGADLIIAAVGAGLRAFTRYARVEYANGEEVPAEKFLGEVESVVLETLLEKIFGVASSRVAAVDGPSRFYVLWRYAYRTAELDAGEAIVFTYGQPVELDGADGLANGTLALVEKKKGKYRLRDCIERGSLEKLGLPDDEGKPAPLVDSLHRLLWLMENEPRKLPAFLDEAHPDRERLRLVAQALAGAGLSGGSENQTGVVNTTPGEQAALGKLLANWRALVPETLFAH
jgi:putative DNA methylase